MLYPQSDLACERQGADITRCGIGFQKETLYGLECQTVSVLNEEGARTMGKPPGDYITLSFPSPAQQSEAEMKALLKASCVLLGRLLPRSASSLLILGLGNPSLTADSVGPAVAQSVHATGHLREEDPGLLEKLACCSLSVFAPGVAAQSGISPAKFAASVCGALLPEGVILVDSLVAGSRKRLFQTIQFSNTGITPGSGVGAHRSPIDQDLLGIPVVSVGIPTVIRMQGWEEEGSPDADPLLVTTRDCDYSAKYLSKILADAINMQYGIADP